MSITANSGPYVAFLDSNNPETAPSCFIEGSAFLDPRSFYTYTPGQNMGEITAAFGTFGMLTCAASPSANATANIAALANVVSGTAMTLVTSTAAGITVGVSITNALTGVAVTVLAIDLGSTTTVPLKPFGASGTINLWNPEKMLARVINITGSAGAAGGNFLVSGYDVYGYPMTQTITAAAGAGPTAGTKAFKYIASVTPQFTDAHNYSIGTTNVFGFPFASQLQWVDTQIQWAGTWLTTTTGYTAGVNTLATATTGDVRGTYLTSTSPDGTLTLIIQQVPRLGNLALTNGVAGTSTGLFGVTQA
jgi:hypothetical protein